MSDKSARPGAELRRWLRFLLVFAVVLALLLVFLLTCTTALDGVKRFFRYGNEAERFSFAPDANADYALLGDRLAMVTPSGTTVFSHDGAVCAQVSASLSSPAVQVAGEQLLVYDIGGTYLSVLDADGVLYTPDVGGAIYDAALAENGSCAVLHAENGSRAVLEVYDGAGVLRYRRTVKTHCLNTCALAPNGQLAAVSALAADAAEVQAAAQLLDIGSENIAAETALGAEPICDLAFLSADALCAVGETSLFFLGSDGALRGVYTEEHGALADYCFSDGRVFAVYRCSDSADTFRLVALDEAGNVTASVSGNGTVLHLSACADYLSVLTEEALFLYDHTPVLHSQTENAGFSHAFVRSDGTALCVADGAAELYIP